MTKTKMQKASARFQQQRRAKRREKLLLFVKLHEEFEALVPQMTAGGEQIHVSKENGAIRFDPVGMRAAYVLMSGRLYRCEFAQPATEPNGSEDQPIITQLNYHGLAEEVDTRLFENKLVCVCGNVRWVKNADLFQIKKCKPCTYRERKERRRDRRLSRK